VADKGDWVASDHRFMLGEDWTLLPPGSSYDVRERRVTHPLQKSPEPFDDTFEDAALALARLVEDAVRRRTAGHDKVAVAFSGGLDSSLLAHCSSKCTKTVAISVGAVGSHDESKAPAAAEELGIELRRVSANTDDVKNELAKLDLPFAVGPMDKSLWCIYSLASKAAAEEGADIVILGQLADELFGGYAKYQTVLVEGGQRRAAEMMSLDVAGCGTRGFLRDEAACSMWIEPRFPFADEEILEFGSRLPVPYKIAGHERKAILRTAAANLGVPKRICDAPKKAAQYSSGLLKLYQQFI
jgi:asparagine synthase (glutamine-hydrolysing)